MASVRAQLDGICIGESTNRKECKTHAKRLQYPWDCNTPGNVQNSCKAIATLGLQHSWQLLQ